MKYLDEYRDRNAAERLLRAIESLCTRPATLMEMCGGQTHSIVKYGIDTLLPREITLIHGPGCPVCVTPLEQIERAIAIAARPEVIFCSFGDMLRVPGSDRDLLAVKADGGDVRMVYSPLDAVVLARNHPDRQVVFFAVGFETTAPANAMAVRHAEQLRLLNFSMLVAQVRVPPAIRAILSAPECRVQGFLAAGHVCTVMGDSEYHDIADRFQVPIVVTGFEPVDILQGVHDCIAQLQQGRCEVSNAYRRAVHEGGNSRAQQLIQSVFTVTDRSWRGIGRIPNSGLALSRAYQHFDAERRFDCGSVSVTESAECISGQILQGHKRPRECPAFGTRCRPDRPLGAPMVSSEGACAAYYRYRNVVDPASPVIGGG